MKILKLATILLLFIGAIILAANWGSLFPEDPSGKEDYPDEDKIDIKEQCDKIRTAWESQAGWYEPLYTEQRADIDQSNNMRLFSRNGYNTVNNCLRETAANKAHDGYLSALKAQPFSADNLATQYKGITLLKQKEQMGSDPRIIEAEKAEALYRRIREFVSSKHPITPHFNSDKAEWTSFLSLQNSIINNAKSLKADPAYQLMKTVPGFEEGLDVKKLKAATDRQRKQFHENLCSQIIDYFNAQGEPTDANVKLLNQIYKNFSYQESNYGLYRLAEFKVGYKVQ